MAGRIRESDIALVRERSRIDEVVGDQVSLKRAGGGALKGLCPFHDEKTPSFNVRPSHGTFHCFGCGEGGDVIAFVMKVEHLSFVEAVERLADRAGIQLVYEGGGATIQRDRGTRSRLIEAHKAAAEYYAEQLATPEAQQAREFLAERGFDEAAARQFGCGFAPGGWDKLTKHLLGRGFELPELIKSQLTKEGKQGPIDRFHRRLLWPIKEISGDVVGFGARRIFDDDPIQAKYLNTSESMIYKKSQVLFGLDQAKREIAKRKQAVIVEGYTDVMAMHLAGVPTAVASCGTAFGTDHMNVLRRLLIDDDVNGEVIFTFDGDEAGQKAALKAFDGEQQFSAQTYIAVAPDGMDPCELRQAKGDVAVRDLVARRTPLIEFAIKAQLKAYDLDSVDGRVEALKKMVPFVAQIKDRAKRDGYATRLAWWVGWDDEAMVVRRVRQVSGGKAPVAAAQRVDPNQMALGVEVDGPARPNPRDPRLLPEREVLKVALRLPEYAGPLYDSLPDEAFTDPAYVALHRAIRAAGGASSGLAGTAYLDAISQACSHASVRSVLTELAVEPLTVKQNDEFRYVSMVIARLQEVQVGKQVEDVKSRLRRLSPIKDADEYRSLWGDLVALEEYRKALLQQSAGVL
ncbi:DNA primase [Lentzea kentuckyensis]|uniref:DNA primase n=1 Tax=Lentzea kentuckyensis TaxID=360086 RepID=UPI000A387B58|nr:DNA primase [Lentzea kentuckyensis]